MTDVAQDFEIVSGNDRSVNITVTDDDGNAVDLTGATITWKAATSPEASSALITKTNDSTNGISVSTPSNGVLTINLDPADTQSLDGVYYHETLVTDSSGNKSTVAIGHMKVRPNLIT